LKNIGINPMKRLYSRASPYSSAGGRLMAMVLAVATKMFVERFHAAEVCETVRWRGGTVFRAPAALYVYSCRPSRTASEQPAQTRAATRVPRVNVL